MKIAIYYSNSPFESGGIGNWIYEVASRLSEKHAVTLLGSSQPSLEMQSQKRVTDLISKKIGHYEFVALKPPIGVALPNPFCLSKILRIINSSDVAYFILPCYPNEALFYLLKKRIRSKIVAGFHGQIRSDTALYKVYLPVFRFALKAFNVYHTLNEQTSKWLKDSRHEIVYCIPNGVDTTVFKLCNSPAKSETFNILYVGWLIDYKGIHVLLEIARRLSKSGINDVKLVICGSGPLEWLVKKASNDLSNIVYLGYVPSEEIQNVYRAAHLFLLPSKMEGMPLSLLEAQSCGLPVVASNIPGILDVSKRGANMKLVHSGDVEGFLNAISSYCNLWRSSPEKYLELCRSTRENAVKTYDWKFVIENIERMLTDTAFSKNSSSASSTKVT